MSRYGGNTSCVVVDVEHAKPIILDAGTGLRFYGLDHGEDDFDGTVLISHLHWDHIQGLPFFSPFLRPSSATTIYGPPEPDQDFASAMHGFLKPPYFPVTIDQLAASFALHCIADTTIGLDGGVTVTAGPVPHNGATNGYRIDTGDVSIAYIPDHQQSHDGAIAPSVLALAEGVDLLIHDAQFSDALLEQRSNWGHCTPDFALDVAEAAGAKTLALFHHDPLHDDDAVDRMLEATTRRATGVHVVAAAEGMKISL